MYSINKITSSSVVDYAAEELKKYLRMMMPTRGDISISYEPSATDGFRLGLMQDFGLDVSDAESTALDDIVYIDCNSEGGIIAGDNARSVLIAVYEYLRKNGCRWLFPGVDGEYIPLKEITPVKYRHKPAMRHRGPCIEGATSQQTLLETIEFIPKLGMNMFMMQFFVPTPFYKSYYSHQHSTVRTPEPIDMNTMLQWKMQCESEIAKRGLEFHDVGHGWAAEPFGIDTSSGWESVSEDVVPEASRKYLAMLNGKRDLNKGRVLTTQFCLSNPQARKLVVDYVVRYARIHTNVDYLYVSLADGQNNHCECDECVKKTVSDWYVMLLNEIDAALTENGISSRIAFSAYTETTWAPTEEKLKNPDRFVLEFAPYSRSYTRTLTPGANVSLVPFKRNDITLPATLDEYIAYYNEWRKAWDGPACVFEYHFWRHQVYDFSGLTLARRIASDVDTYQSLGFSGIVACGSQRAYFPNGFAYYVFARKQFDISVTYDELLEDYYSTAYGTEWRDVAEYLDAVGKAIDFGYLEGEMSEDPEKSLFYSPRIAEKLKLVPEITRKGEQVIKAHSNDSTRVQRVSFDLLSVHTEYSRLAADALYHKALGDNERAKEKYNLLAEYMSEREVYIERCYDLSISIGFLWEILVYSP